MKINKNYLYSLFSMASMFFQALASLITLSLITNNAGLELFSFVETAGKAGLILGSIMTLGAPSLIFQTKRNDLDVINKTLISSVLLISLIFLLFIFLNNLIFTESNNKTLYFLVLCVSYNLALSEIKATYFSALEMPMKSIVIDRIARPATLTLCMWALVNWWQPAENSLLIIYMGTYSFWTFFGFYYFGVLKISYLSDISGWVTDLKNMLSIETQLSHISNLTSVLSKNIDVLLASILLNTPEFAIYALGARFFQVFNFIYVGFMTASSGKIINLYRDSPKKLKQFYKRNGIAIVIAMLLLAIVIFSSFDFIAENFFSIELVPGKYVFIALSLASFINLVTGPTVLLLRSSGHANLTVFASILSLLPYIVLLIIPHHSVLTIACSFVASIVILKILSLYFYLKLNKNNE